MATSKKSPTPKKNSSNIVSSKILEDNLPILCTQFISKKTDEKEKIKILKEIHRMVGEYLEG